MTRDGIIAWMVGGVIVVQIVIMGYCIGVRDGVKDGIKLERNRVSFEKIQSSGLTKPAAVSPPAL